MLVSMFVLIAAALPAQSLALSAIVASQRELWNVVRQPLGLPLFLLVGLSLTLRGPFDYADSADLAGGTSAETSGADARAVATGAAGDAAVVRGDGRDACSSAARSARGCPARCGWR